MKSTILYLAIVLTIGLVNAQEDCSRVLDCDLCTNHPSGVCGWCSPQGVCLNSTRLYSQTPPINGQTLCTVPFGGTWIQNATECPAEAENCTLVHQTDCSSCETDPRCGFCTTPAGANFPPACFQAAFQGACTLAQGTWNSACGNDTTTTGEATTTTAAASTTAASSTTGASTTAQSADSAGAVTVLSFVLLVTMALVSVF